MGFRSKLGTGLYSQWGTLPNEYAFEPARGRVRPLFIGDSVTARGRIVEALRQAEGDAGHEYWNAGFESFNTVQEVAFYRRFNAAILPSQVIVTFHLNDFQSTPVALRGDDGELVVYSPRQPKSLFNARLFAASHLYRAWVALRAPGGDRARGARRLVEPGGQARSRRAVPQRHRPSVHGAAREMGAESAHAASPHHADARSRRHPPFRPVAEPAQGARRRHRSAGAPGRYLAPECRSGEVFAADLLDAGLLEPDCR